MSRLNRLIHEHIGDVIIVLGAIAVLLTIEALRRAAGEAGGEVEAVETTIEVASKILGLVLGIIGAIAGYRRFFKGRTFAERMVLGLRSTPVRWMQMPDGGRGLLHAVDVELSNVGSTTIWEPAVRLKVRSIDSDEEVGVEPGVASEGIEHARSPGAVSGIEPGETEVVHRRFFVPATVEVFRVTVEASTSRGNAWHRALTLANVHGDEG
ncbi:MAG: hypothetical protein H6712_34145 [Myxococcales bacterium]|nr:hypothetical protein [Myxococcales bacterium]MCB9718936.1 hypothetical protein [Myxococcales bacterium]